MEHYEICSDPCDELCENIRHNLTFDIATTIYDFAKLFDPTESNHAAHLRDAIRDTFDCDL